MKTSRRRGNNEGSIYQRPDGRWAGALSGPGGTRKFVYGRTKDEVQGKLVQAMHARLVRNASESRSMSVGSFLDQWLERTAKPSVRPYTYHGYEVQVRVHIKPTLGRIPLDQLQPAHVQALISAKLEQGLAPKTVHYMYSTLRNALHQAMRWEYVTRNVAALVGGPRMERYEIQPFTREETHQFLDAIKGNRLEALYTVALTMGLRQGEALGLRWRDTDLEMGYIRVNKQLQRIDRKYTLTELKTGRSRRTLAVPSALVGALREHKERQDAERVIAGLAWHETDLVFARRNGSPLNGSVVTHGFQELLERIGLPKRRFHDLRHSCATLLLAQGISPRVVMEVLGHSQIALTMNTYTHVLPELRREAADRMNDLMLQNDR
jgi:integrase